MTIGIDKDERYPDYSIINNPQPRHDTMIEVDKETLARWDAAIAAYNAVQREMEDLYKQANRKREQ